MSSPADAAMDVPHFLYRCFTADGDLLYVGVARDVEHRMFHHLHACNAHKQPNGSLRRHMARHEAEQFPTKLAARAAERAAILAERPLLNRQHNPSRFRKVGTHSYGLLAPVHPISLEAFAGSPLVEAGAA